MQQSFFSFLILLTAAVAAVGLAKRARLPSLLAYLAVGMALGPHGFRLLAESNEVEKFAELGVAFLMFSIGLEFSLPRIKAMRAAVFGFGGSQVLLTAAMTALVTWLGYGQKWDVGLAIGLAVAMSSTAIVARMLSDRFELHSRSGRQTMGVLLFQDIAVVPCMILLPALARPGDDFAWSLGIALLQTIVVLTLLIGLGRLPIKLLLDVVARRRSQELFVLATLWIVLILSFLTQAAGLSLALGAFIGGMLISETMYRHQVESDIRPFRDILLGLFFVSIGMMLDLGYVLAHLHLLLLTTLLLIGGKGAVVLLVAHLAKTPLNISVRTAAQLAQGGEFGLVLMQLAHDHALIGADAFQVTLTAMLVSMFVAPFLIERAAGLSGSLSKGDWAHKAKAIHDIAVGTFDKAGHVIICGYGRTGQRIAEFLSAENIPFVALEIDPALVKQPAPAGGVVVFGSADRAEVLKAAGLARAKGIVVAYPDIPSAERVIHLVRHERTDIPIMVRAPDESSVSRLKQAGATEVIPEILEGSLMIAAETMVQLGIPVERAIGRVRMVRAERYASLREFYQGNFNPPAAGPLPKKTNTAAPAPDKDQ